MKRVKVFHFPFKDSNSGVAHYVFNNWKFIDRDKFAFDFGTVGPKNAELEKKTTEFGIPLRYISCYAEQDLERFIDEVSGLFLKERYDAVHLHTSFWKSFLVEEIALECNIPKIIVHSHSTHIDITDDAARMAAERLHNQKKRQFNTSLATDFCACSEIAADWLFGPQIPRERIKIMKNAIDVKRCLYNKEIRDSYRRKLGLDDCFVVGHVGRFCYQKNHEFLLRFFARLFGKMKNARLLLIGSGPLEREIRAQAEQLNISDKVVMLGSRPDVSQLLQAMDVFCLPSRFEGLPIVLVEAQSAGLKCFVSDSVTKEVKLTDNITFLPPNEADWEEAIRNIAKGYERKDMYQEITAAGYNIERQVREVKRLYLA